MKWHKITKLHFIVHHLYFILPDSLHTSPFESCHHLLGECRGSEVVVAPWRSPSRAQPVCGSFLAQKGMFATTQIPIVKSKLIVKSRTESQMKSLLIFKVSMWSFFEIMILPKKSSNFLHVSLHVHHQILWCSSKLRRTQESQKMLKSFHQCQWTPSDQGLNRVCLENGKVDGLSFPRMIW